MAVDRYYHGKHVEAFTLRAGGRPPAIVTPVRVISIPQTSTGDLLETEVNGLWDTGASRSVVSSRVVAALNLQPVGRMRIAGVNGSAIQQRFIVGMRLSDRVGIQRLDVTEGVLSDHFDMLIGMDVISIGDLALTADEETGETVFSFQVPSVGPAIDFGRQIEDYNAAITKARVESQRIRHEMKHHKRAKRRR